MDVGVVIGVLIMAFFKKKEEELPSDIDLDVPPEPPKMLGEEISTEGPIDEELMPGAKIMKSKAKSKEEELPELPPLPEMEEELPPLPELEEKKHEELELPPPPGIKPKKKGLFPFILLKNMILPYDTNGFIKVTLNCQGFLFSR